MSIQWDWAQTLINEAKINRGVWIEFENRFEYTEEWYYEVENRSIMKNDLNDFQLLIYRHLVIITNKKEKR